MWLAEKRSGGGGSCLVLLTRLFIEIIVYRNGLGVKATAATERV